MDVSDATELHEFVTGSTVARCKFDLLPEGAMPDGSSRTVDREGGCGNQPNSGS
jgi:hypothetical protein